MPVTLNQTSFGSGEISPSLYGRVDISRWQSALKVCRNFIVRPFGGIDNRPGTRFIGEVKTSADGAREIPFSFNTEQTYQLEFGDQYIRVFKDGAPVISSGVPYEIASPYLISEVAQIKYTQSADVLYLVHPNHEPRTLSRTDHDAWVLDLFDFKNGPFQPLNVNETVVVWIDAPVNDITTVYASGDVFTADMVGSLFYIEQSVLVDTAAWEVGKVVVAGDVRTANGHYYKAFSGGTTGTLRPGHIEGRKSDGAVSWEYLHSGFGICEIIGYTSPTEVEVTVTRLLPESLVGTFGSVLVPVSVTTLKVGSAPYKSWWTARLEVTGHGYSTGDIVVIDGATSNNSKFQTWLNGQHTITVIDANNFRLNGSQQINDSNPTITVTGVGSVREEGTAFVSYKWAHGSWGPGPGWPSVVNFFQQRIVFAATRQEPQTFWTSRVDGYNDFGRESPVLDDDAITGTIAARQVNAIRNITSLQDMILHTSGGEWTVLGQDNVITPATLSLRAQSYYGSSDVTPVVSGNVALFVQEKGNIIRDLGYSFDVDGYSGSNLSQLAEHLFRDRTVVDWAYAPVPYDAVFLVMSDGALLTLTYVRDQDVIGWARHDTDGAFEAVSVISEDGRDAVYFVVRREVNGSTVRYIERLEKRISAEIEQAFFVDSGLSYDGRNTGATTMTLSGTWGNADRVYTLTASASAFVVGDVGDAIFLPYVEEEVAKILKCTITAYTSATEVTVTANRNPPLVLQAVATTDWGFARKTFSGLDHLEAKTVAVLADGNVHPQLVVESGSITLQYPAQIVHAGLPIQADMQSLELNSIEDSVRDKAKIIHKVAVLAESSRGLFAGPNPDNLREVKQSVRTSYDYGLPVKSGLFEVHTPAEWGRGGNVFIRQDDPLPLSILALLPQVTVGGAL